MSEMFPNKLDVSSIATRQTNSSFFGNKSEGSFFSAASNSANQMSSTMGKSENKATDVHFNEYSSPKKEHFYFIHGTGSTPRVWKKYDGKIIDIISENMGDSSKSDEVHTLKWNGCNNSKKREEAVKSISKEIYLYHSKNKGEPITIVGHSHGGNIALEIVNKLSYLLPDEKIQLITLNTPVRSDYQPKYNENVKHFNFFIPNDHIQTKEGGYILTGKIIDPKSGCPYPLPALPPRGFIQRQIILAISRKLSRIIGNAFNIEIILDESIAPKLGGEAGPAENKFDFAVNIEVKSPVDTEDESIRNKPLRHRLWHKTNLPALREAMSSINETQ